MPKAGPGSIDTPPAETPGAADSQQPARLGRKRDQTRDVALLDAALDILAEVGYDAMTVDMVAARAHAGKATAYRRWPSKAALVIDAIARMEQREVAPAQLPDTGTLRGDLVALMTPATLVEGERRLRIMAGLASLLAQDNGLAAAANAALVTPWIVANRAIIGRAIERGEAADTADLTTIAHVIPSMAAYRVLIQRGPLDREFLLALIDGVVLPALRPPAGRSP